MKPAMDGILLYQITDGVHRVRVRTAGARFIVRADGSDVINIVKTVKEARETADLRLASLQEVARLREKIKADHKARNGG